MQKKKYLFPAILGLLLIVTGILLIIILPFSEKEEKTINKNPVPTSTPEATMPPEDSIISYTKHTYYICQKEPTEITHEASGVKAQYTNQYLFSVENDEIYYGKMVLTYELKTSKDYDKFIEDLGTTDGNYTVEKYKKEKKVVETASFYLPSADEKGNTFNDDYMKMLEEMGYTCALDE